MQKKFKVQRKIRYLYLRLIRLRGEPHELALGMAIGVFAGLTPTMPFHIIMAVALALCFRASKITAAVGVWVSNPLTWVPIYLYNYKLGALIIGLPETNSAFSSIMNAIQLSGEGSLGVAKALIGSSSAVIAAFLIGGLAMGITGSIASYFLFLYIFKRIRIWRQSRKEKRRWADKAY